MRRLIGQLAAGLLEAVQTARAARSEPAASGPAVAALAPPDAPERRVERLVSLRELTVHTGISRDVLARYAKDGMPSVLVRGQPMFLRSAAAEWLREHGSPPSRT